MAKWTARYTRVEYLERLMDAAEHVIDLYGTDGSSADPMTELVATVEWVESSGLGPAALPGETIEELVGDASR